ncbi:MAG: COX15/CtaA family protein [Acidimicrobiia bacterium]
MNRFRLSSRTYRYITLAALLSLCVIIVTGAAVRLTGSGLGCTDWPNCSPGRLAPHSASDTSAMIEFVNRVFTGFVSAAVMAAVLGSLLRLPRRRDLTWLSLGLVAGVIGQIVLGGITVLFELAPPLVAGHFVLSIVLIWNALVLYRRAGIPDGAQPQLQVSRQLRTLARMIVGAVWLVIITGTVVTGSGPHAGDLDAKRYNLAVPDVARIHGITESLFLVLVIVTIVVAWRSNAASEFRKACNVLLVAILIQGAIGYAQYFTGVPAWLVTFHIVGSVAVFLASTQCALASYRWVTSTGSADSAPTPNPQTALV